MKSRLALGALLGLVMTPWALAQDTSPVSLKVIPSEIRATVGDRLLVRVEVSAPAGVTFSPPVPIPGEGASLSLEPMKPPASDQPSAKNIFYFQAQAFETGTVQIPAMSVDWKKPGGEGGKASSAPIAVEIVSVLKGPQEAPADLKPPAQIPGPPFPWTWAALGAGLLALIIALLVWLRRRKTTVAAPPLPSTPLLPPHEQAYREMERLLSGSLLREGKIKEFHVELAEIVKRYLAARFNIDTLERTSFEVLEDLKRVRVGSEPLAVAREFFMQTDLVKFAKHFPVEDEIRRGVDRAYRLVDLTKLVVAVESPPGEPAPAALVTGSAG
jgi:hypothetical protein